MEKIVTFATNETTEVWSPLSTGTLGVSLAAKDSSGLSPINSSNNISSSNNDEYARPTTPTHASHFSSTPFILSASTSSPNLLVDKSNPSVFARYRDSPKAKLLAQNSSKLQEQVKVLQAQLSSSEQRQEMLEKENSELKKQVKMLQDHVIRQESSFNLRIEEAVRIEDENASLSKAVGELTTRVNGLNAKLSEADGDAARMNAELDDRLAEIASVRSELKSAQAKIAELTATLVQISTDDEHLIAENKNLQQNVKTLENELSLMRTRCQDKHDLMVAAERQRDALEDKLRQCERKLSDFEENGLGENMSSGLGTAATSSQMQIHLMSQLDNFVSDQLKNQFENIFNKKISELAQAMSTQSQTSASQAFVPSAPASIAGNDYEDVSSIKAESIVSNSRILRAPELEQLSELNAADATVTSNCGSAGLGDFGSVLRNPTSTSTWKKQPPASAPIDGSEKVIDWLPIDPENEEIFEEEARWRDREFVKRTAIGAANRKRLIQQEESRPSFPLPAQSKQPDPNERLYQLAERNRRQPMHMRSAYPIEESTFLVSENDLRTGKAVSIEALTAVSSTPLHSDQNQQASRMAQPFRVPKVPVARPVSMYTAGGQTPQHPPPVVQPSSIPKPTQIIISPPNKTQIVTPKPAPATETVSNVASESNKENAVAPTKAALMIISPPSRKPTKAAEPEPKPANAAKLGQTFIISPPQKNAQKLEKARNNGQKGATKSTSTPKKFLGAVARAFGSSSSKNTADQKTDI